MFLKVSLGYLICLKQIINLTKTKQQNINDVKSFNDTKENVSRTEDEKQLFVNTIKSLAESDTESKIEKMFTCKEIYDKHSLKTTECDDGYVYEAKTSLSQSQILSFSNTAEINNLKIESMKCAFNDIKGCNFRYSCFRCENKEEFMIGEKFGPFVLKVPKEIFEDYNNCGNYTLCVNFLPFFKSRRLSVTTNEDVDNLINITINSDWLSENTFQSNVAMYFEIKEANGYVMKSKIFNLKKMNLKEKEEETFYFTNSQKTSQSVENLSEQNENFLKPGIQKCYYDKDQEKYVYEFKNKEVYTLNTTVCNEFVLFIFYIPFLLCPANFAFFEEYKNTFQRKIDDLPENSKKILNSFYDYVLEHQGISYSVKVGEMVLHLYNVLVDIINNFSNYKVSECFREKLGRVESDISTFANAKKYLICFKIYLIDLPNINLASFTNFERCFNSLNVIYECLFDIEKEKNTCFNKCFA